MVRQRIAGAVLVVALCGCGSEDRPADRNALVPGVNANGVWSTNDAANFRREAAAMGRSGLLRYVRTTANWEAIEPLAPVAGRHRYKWAVTDEWVAALARSGLTWWPILGYTPGWAKVAPALRFSPPADLAQYAAYARALVRRYGRDGDFWRTNPTLEAHPITTAEVWNEPDLAHYWQPAPSPARYARLYLAARAAIADAVPDITVLVGGLSGDGAAFLQDMVEAVPSLHGQLDGVSLHPYGRDAADVLANVATTRAALRALGEGAVPIDVTEVGWPTNGPAGPLRLAERQRARELGALPGLLARSGCGVRSLLPFDWSTTRTDPGNAEEWYGIFLRDGSALPSGTAFLSALRRLGPDRQPGAAGRPRGCR